MTVLIKGMEMPKSCGECLEIGWQYVFECNLDDVEEGEKLITCPLVPVPTPHGRLIDVDYADEYAYDELEVANAYLTGWEAARNMQKIYRNSPTIIEADKEGE